MDLATLLGLVAGSAIILLAALLGGTVDLFFDIPSVLIVGGCGLATVFIRFGLSDVINSGKVAMNAFRTRVDSPRQTIQALVDLATLSRKNGLLALEEHPIPDPFLKKAILYCVDGHAPEFITEVLNREIELTMDRHEVGRRVFAAMGEAAPAFGMVGTLIGLVQMLTSMDDPGSIGPGMAVALLTTLYGALIANFICLPIADKLTLRSQEEERNRRLIVEGVLGILKGTNPRIMQASLEIYLPPNARGTTSSADGEPKVVA